MVIKFNEVKCDSFVSTREAIQEDSRLKSACSVYYYGNEHYGELVVDLAAGNDKETQGKLLHLLAEHVRR